MTTPDFAHSYAAYFLTFMMMVITDICWAVYIVKVQRDLPVQAGLWAVGLFLTGAFAIVGYTTNPWLLIPAGLGAFTGTYLGVMYERHRRNTAKS